MHSGWQSIKNCYYLQVILPIALSESREREENERANFHDVETFAIFDMMVLDE